MELAEIIRRRRLELGMSQAAVASRAGVDARQIRRYEAGEQQPVFRVAVAIAGALELSLADLAGLPEHRVQLGGDWFAAWETVKDGAGVVAVQPVRLQQQLEHIRIEALERGRPVEEGGFIWSGELRLWDNEILIGWYAATDAGVRSKGSLYFVLHPQGLSAGGRWVGLSYDGLVVTGRGALARSADDAHRLVTSDADAPARVAQP